MQKGPDGKPSGFFVSMNLPGRSELPIALVQLAHAGDEQVRVVERGAEGVDERVAQLGARVRVDHGRDELVELVNPAGHPELIPAAAIGMHPK